MQTRGENKLETPWLKKRCLDNQLITKHNNLLDSFENKYDGTLNIKLKKKLR